MQTGYGFLETTIMAIVQTDYGFFEITIMAIVEATAIVQTDYILLETTITAIAAAHILSWSRVLSRLTLAAFCARQIN